MSTCFYYYVHIKSSSVALCAWIGMFDLDRWNSTGLQDTQHVANISANYYIQANKNSLDLCLKDSTNNK